uniref:Uncharacterized protein n=1 Tax=Tanacetum cinerariifolium TaxID=118510 RepID=A0A6L2JMJ4_TANCI|nr:hypothetical protein [Tanacetum cinerariifolium]
MAAPGAGNQVARRVIDDLVDLSEAQTKRNLIARLNALIAEIEEMEDQGEVYDTLMGLRDDRRVENTKLMGLNDPITQEGEEIEMKETHDALKEFFNERSDVVDEDYRLAKEIYKVTMEVYNMVSARVEFIEVLDNLGVRPVPAKLAEFLKEIQMKDREIVVYKEVQQWCLFFGFLDQNLVLEVAVIGYGVTLSKHRRLIAELKALGHRGDALRDLDYMREIFARDTAKLGVLEQLLACTHVGIPLKVGYVANMEEKY